MASTYGDTSNTTAQTTVTVDDMIRFAYKEAGKLSEEMTPEYVNDARLALWYLLINLSNRGVNLWLLEYLMIGSAAQLREYQMPRGTVDVRVANYRLLTRPSTTTDNIFGAFNTTSVEIDYPILAGDSAHAYYEDGYRFLSAGFNSSENNVSLDVEYSFDDITWNTLGSVSNSDVNSWGYKQIDGSPMAKFWRFKNSSPSTVTVRALSLASVQQDIPLARLNRDSYFNLPNKDFPSNRSLQYWFDRQVTPIVNLWPVPQDYFQAFQFIIEMQPQDVGKLTNEIAVPDRWLPCLQKQLSASVAKILPGIDEARIARLSLEAKELTLTAEDEDRDKSPIYFQPNISYYTK